MGGDLTQGGINSIGLCGQAFLAVDRSGDPTNNNVYMLASVLPNGQSTTEVMFVRSTDGGPPSARHFASTTIPSLKASGTGLAHFRVAPNGRH